MPLGTEVDLSPGHIVLDGDPAHLPQKGALHGPQVFGPCLVWPNGWMDEDATWYGSRPQLKPHCVRWGPSSPRERGTAPPLFGPCLLWLRSPISDTAELLYSVPVTCSLIVLGTMATFSVLGEGSVTTLAFEIRVHLRPVTRGVLGGS